MRSAVAPESRRAQAFTSSIMTSAMVSMPMIYAIGSAFSNQGGTASCFFLVSDLWEMGLDSLWERGKHGLYGPKPPLSHPLQFLFFCSIQGEQLLASCLSPHGLGWPFRSGGLSALAGLCRSPGCV